MNRITVLIGEDLGTANLARLRQAYADVTFHFCTTDEEFMTVAGQADVIFSKRFPQKFLSQATRLRWIQAGTAGVERLLALDLAERQILLTNASGAHGVPMAEVVLAMMLAFATGLHTLIRAQTAREHKAPQVIRDKFELDGQSLCVLGLGDIGGTLVRKSKRLGMRVVGVRRSRRAFSDLDAQYTSQDLPLVLPTVDHVALCLPLTDQTSALIGRAELRAMKPTAYIYNVGRGRSIDAVALADALREGWIAGAGLDVTDPEPLPPDSPLWTAPNVILSKHTSGSSPFNADRTTAIFMDNLDRFLRGEPLRHEVDLVRGY